uniref:RecF/RecN/SMC N-terminal domain-containing protein n=1 Tax=Fundulus heteroclitus TaxID=8078 RepID=A0A3Q2Q8Y9_FUNHE
MYIKSIIIEGFKSYAQRTEINGFDPLFNAITGLNGSGKSNILDSICFVLGISNLSHVRASNLQDLVYKNGQGGITKATVSITFDNSNKSQSPLGFETHDEITVTRQVRSWLCSRSSLFTDSGLFSSHWFTSKSQLIRDLTKQLIFESRVHRTIKQMVHLGFI